MQQRRAFSEEFKREATKLIRQPGASKASIARDLGVGANLLGRWCREFVALQIVHRHKRSTVSI